jgi:uncharacterized protein YgbK (DUF1537 family)
MKTVVLDDDPTGTGTATGVRVLLRWDADRLTAALSDGDAVYLQTNSRAIDEPAAVTLCRRIRKEIDIAATRLGEPVQVVLRGDSTLRGHVFAETDVFATDEPILFVPAFPGGGRVTIDGTHYVEVDGQRVSAERTEYAKDPVFGFSHGDLVGYVREQGHRSATTVPLAAVRETDGQAVADALLAAPAGTVVAPDAETDADIDLVHAGLLAARERGGRVVVRCAAPLAARCAGVASRGLLEPPLAGGGPVLVVCGSHTTGATAQLAELHRSHGGTPLVIDTDAALADSAAAGRAVVADAEKVLAAHGLVVITSQRNRRAEHNTLAHGQAVMSALMTAVKLLAPSVQVVISKGGITSADVTTIGLGADTATVRGQILPGVSVFDLDTGATCVIVPGNVGGPTTLSEIVRAL